MIAQDSPVSFLYIGVDFVEFTNLPADCLELSDIQVFLQHPIGGLQDRLFFDVPKVVKAQFKRSIRRNDMDRLDAQWGKYGRFVDFKDSVMQVLVLADYFDFSFRFWCGRGARMEGCGKKGESKEKSQEIHSLGSRLRHDGRQAPINNKYLSGNKSGFFAE